MKYQWSPSLAAFNAAAADNVEISKEKFDALFEGQACGKVIITGPDGLPQLADAQQPDVCDIALLDQSQRLTVAAFQISIIQPAVDGGYAKPEHTQLLADWQRYRYELTQVPEQTGWPETPQWPTEPDKVI